MDRSMSCRLGFALFAGLALGGCCGDRNTRPGAGGRAEREVEREEVYCRKFPANATIGTHITSWPLLPLALTDLESKTDADFAIIKDFKPVPTSALTIDQHDRFVLAPSGGTYTLTHTDAKGNLKATVEKLYLHSDKLWAYGNVVNALGNDVGTYYIYRTKDRQPCKHPKPLDGNPCREFHFEYFAIGDLPGERPVVGVNVKKATNGLCSTALETDEGDGDEGKRR